MKTQMKFNPAKTGLTAFATLCLVSFSFTLRAADPIASLAALEKFSISQNSLLKYVAPSAIEMEDYLNTLESIEQMTDKNLVSLRYVAPRADLFVPETEELEAFAEKELASLKYTAPFETETIETHEIDLMATAMQTSLKYQAPVTTDDFTSDSNNDEQMLAETIK